MLSRLPHEVRLDIFHRVFAYSFGREVLRVVDTAEGIAYRFTCEWSERRRAGALSLLDDAVMGQGVAAAAAEALYRSDVTFGVDAKILLTFLQSCPFSRAVQPGKYIKRLHLYMDEDPNFVGDGKDGQGLRKADWVDLESGPTDYRITRSGSRTVLMRQCWRAILNMPKLNGFEFWIMPSQGKISTWNLWRWEIRDIVPMHFRLFCRHIDATINLRTWEPYREPKDNKYKKWLYRIHHPDPDDDGFYESHVDLSPCIPYKWAEPTDDERSVAEDTPEPGDSPDNRYGVLDCFNVHAILNYDALQDLRDRLVVDKSTFTRSSSYADMLLSPSRL